MSRIILTLKLTVTVSAEGSMWHSYRNYGVLALMAEYKRIWQLILASIVQYLNIYFIISLNLYPRIVNTTSGKKSLYKN